MRIKSGDNKVQKALLTGSPGLHFSYRTFCNNRVTVLEFLYAEYTIGKDESEQRFRMGRLRGGGISYS